MFISARMKKLEILTLASDEPKVTETVGEMGVLHLTRAPAEGGALPLDSRRANAGCPHGSAGQGVTALRHSCEPRIASVHLCRPSPPVDGIVGCDVYCCLGDGRIG